MGEDKKSNLSGQEIEEGIKNIDPTKLGGLDGNMPGDLDPEIMNWAKSRGKKKK